MNPVFQPLYTLRQKITAKTTNAGSDNHRGNVIDMLPYTDQNTSTESCRVRLVSLSESSPSTALLLPVRIQIEHGRI
jgi:hypothetical protein